MEKKLQLIWLFFFLVILPGCIRSESDLETSASQVPSAVNLPSFITRESTITEIPKLETQTIAPALTTLTPQIKDTVTPSSIREEKCLQVIPIEDFRELNGTLILRSIPPKMKAIYKNMATLRDEVFPSDPYYAPGNFVASNDLYRLAYGAAKKQGLDSLIVQSSDRQKQYVYLQDNQIWDSIAYWVDNQFLLLQKYDEPYDRFTLFNTFTGEQKPIDIHYPDMVLEDWGWQWIVSFDNTISRVVYIGFDKTTNSKKVILFDLDNNKKLFEHHHVVYSLQPPTWSLDSKQFAFLDGNDIAAEKDTHNEIVLVDREGKLIFTTRLSPYYSNLKISAFSWSPDSRYIAFIMSTLDQNAYIFKLMLLDTLTHSVIDLCFSPQWMSRIVWSPDSHYLVVNSSTDSDIASTYLIDVVHSKSSVIGENLEAYAWMK